MARSRKLLEAYKALRRDKWRQTNPFSDGVATVNVLAWDTFASKAEIALGLSRWLQKHQPCLFGRIAAAMNTMHYCIITDADIQQRTDDEIRELIHADVLAWKRRSLRPHGSVSRPAHGLMLVVASSHVALAAPDDRLQEFSNTILELWGCPRTQEESGTVFWESLFLEHPTSGDVTQFTFSVDFFAAQGDGRWWSDHRIPGGIAFTANSAGHMGRYREWYGEEGDQGTWILKTAMHTIALAAETPYGRATWLRALDNAGQPFLREFANPFPPGTQLNALIKDKDWTRYAGFLHTDHSVRPEFFRDEPDLAAEHRTAEYLEDFTYLYNPSARDFVKFIKGEPITLATVYELVGSPESWVKVSGPRAGKPRPAASRGKSRHRERIQAALASTEAWELTAADLEGLARSQQ